MKIEITKSEFKTLFEMIEIAEWILHAHKIDEPEEPSPIGI